MPDEFSHFEDQLQGWCWCIVRGKGKGGFVRGGRKRAKNYWEQWWPPGHGSVYWICGRKSTLSPARMENSVSGDEEKGARVKERGKRRELCSVEEKHGE